jgi:molybdate transport system substrate-binding protein
MQLGDVKKNMSKQNNLHVFSAGAVAPPIKKCAKEFKAKSGTEFDFTLNKAEILIEEIAKNREGDLLTCGSEYILDHAQLKGLVLKETRRSLGSRTSAILVQKGNPKGIRSMSDLAKEGVQIGVSVSGCLTGVWDDLATKAKFTEQIRKNTIACADGCGELMSFINKKKVDAILGWDAFKNLNMETMDKIDLPEDLQVHRSTAIGVITFSRNKELAKKFTDFLVSEEGKRIYEEYGWHRVK